MCIEKQMESKLTTNLHAASKQQKDNNIGNRNTINHIVGNRDHAAIMS
jgi:hypothetical protein